MWNYEKRLEYPINIKRTDAAMAKAIISQFGGPDGETGAAMRYLSQRFAMPYRPVMGVLTDVGIEASTRNLPGRVDKRSLRIKSSIFVIFVATRSHLLRKGRHEKVLILTQLYKTQSRQNQYLFMLAFSNILL